MTSRGREVRKRTRDGAKPAARNAPLAPACNAASGSMQVNVAFSRKPTRMCRPVTPAAGVTATAPCAASLPAASTVSRSPTTGLGVATPFSSASSRAWRSASPTASETWSRRAVM